MSRPKVLIVAGLGRCGTTLAMRMLVRGGMPVHPSADRTAFEESETNVMQWPVDESVWEARDGLACKVLDLGTRARPSLAPELTVVWLQRDYKEQSRSAIKFAEVVSGLPAGYAKRNAIETSLRRDTRTALKWLKSRANVTLYRLSFAELLKMGYAVDQLAEIAAPFAALDVAEMRAEVRVREPRCLPYMLETELPELESR